MAEPARRRTAARPSPTVPVRISVPLDAEDHAKLCAAAALQQRDRSALAAEILRDGLKGLVAIFDRRKSAGRVDLADEGIDGIDAA